MIEQLFEIMRCNIEVMAQYGDDEATLLHELENADDEMLAAYQGIFMER